MKTSVRDLCLQGSLAGLTLGTHKRTVLDYLGVPEDIGGASRRSPARILKYGDVEIHLDTSDTVVLIHIDTFGGANGAPRGFGNLALHPWIIREGKGVRVLCSELSGQAIPHKHKAIQMLDQRLITFTSGAHIGFAMASGVFRLAYVSLSSVG